MQIRIGIIDDHPAIAQGVSAELGLDKNFRVLFIVSERERILGALHEQTPDVLIMDVVMPGSVSVDAFRDVKTAFPDLQIVAYTALNSPAMIELLFRTGVRGYVNKGQTLKELKEAVYQVHAGGIFLPGDYDFIRKKLEGHAVAEELSKREIEILNLIALEKKTAEISEELFISISTVETHRKNLFRKLNVNNLAGLIKAGMRLGYIQ